MQDWCSVCPVCEKNVGKVVDDVPGFRVVECKNCGLQYADPLAYDVDSYTRAYEKGEGEIERQGNYRAAFEAAVRFGISNPVVFLTAAQRQALAWLKKNLLPGSPVLDVGCGVGYFLAALEEAGFEAYGIDVAGPPVSFLKEIGFKVAVGTIENIPEEWPEPHAVTVFELLEHLPDPVGFLRQIYSRFSATPLLVSVPSPRRWRLAVGKREISDYPPHHLTRWSERALVEAFRRAGYERIEIVFPPVMAEEIHGSGLGMMLKRFLARREALNNKAGAVSSKPFLLKEATLRRMKRYIYWPVAVALTLLGRSSLSCLIVARR